LTEVQQSKAPKRYVGLIFLGIRYRNNAALESFVRANLGRIYSKGDNRDLEFDALESTLQMQLKRLVDEGKEALRLKRVDVARQCMAVKGRTERDLALVRTARENNYPVPKTKCTERKVIKKCFYEHIGSNQLEVGSLFYFMLFRLNNCCGGADRDQMC
jgi:hypothetical protein